MKSNQLDVKLSNSDQVSPNAEEYRPLQSPVFKRKLKEEKKLDILITKQEKAISNPESLTEDQIKANQFLKS
jgi:hypothetical protein